MLRVLGIFAVISDVFVNMLTCHAESHKNDVKKLHIGCMQLHVRQPCKSSMPPHNIYTQFAGHALQLLQKLLSARHGTNMMSYCNKIDSVQQPCHLLLLALANFQVGHIKWPPACFHTA